MGSLCCLTLTTGRFSPTELLPPVEMEFGGRCRTIWPSPAPSVWLPLPVKWRLVDQVLMLSKMPQRLIAVATDTGRHLEPVASVRLSPPRGLYSAGSTRGSNMNRLSRVRRSQRQSRTRQGCAPTSQDTIHSANFTTLFLHLSSILSEGRPHC